MRTLATAPSPTMIELSPRPPRAAAANLKLRVRYGWPLLAPESGLCIAPTTVTYRSTPPQGLSNDWEVLDKQSPIPGGTWMSDREIISTSSRRGRRRWQSNLLG